MMRLEFLNTQTTSGSYTFGCTNHTIRLDYARGNQHQRTEHGHCVHCDKRFSRVIRWGMRNAQWWKPA